MTKNSRITTLMLDDLGSPWWAPITILLLFLSLQIYNMTKMKEFWKLPPLLKVLLTNSVFTSIISTISILATTSMIAWPWSPSMGCWSMRCSSKNTFLATKSQSHGRLVLKIGHFMQDLCDPYCPIRHKQLIWTEPLYDLSFDASFSIGLQGVASMEAPKKICWIQVNNNLGSHMYTQKYVLRSIKFGSIKVFK